MPSHPSPLRYPGGKHSLAPLLAEILSVNDLHDGTMVEPYAGGAGASLRLMFDEYVSELVLNDLDPRIFAFWRAVLNQTDDLVRRVARCALTMSTWHKCRAIYDGGVSRTSQLELAFAVFFLNRCNRSGIMMGGGPIGGYAQDGTWKLDARFNRPALISRIRRVANYRERIKVSKLDALHLLKELPATPRMLVYLDPPYFKKGQRLYLNSLEKQDHSDLAELLLSNPPFHWVLTYDSAPEIRKLYRSLKPRSFELSYSAYERRVGRELLIIDPRLAVPDAFLKTQNRPGQPRFKLLRSPAKRPTHG